MNKKKNAKPLIKVNHWLSDYFIVYNDWFNM